MTENDNIRHYIGSLEATEDIDVMFKHIYDLMLANGGEGSGLNADMLDGYHASDFAPASLKDSIDYAIQEITIGGRSYNKGEPLEIQISDIINDGKTDYAIAQFNTLEKIINNIKSSIDNLDTRADDVQAGLERVNNIAGFISSEDMRSALTTLTQNNLKIIGQDEEQKYYLDADSVNGLSLQVVTQEMYDNLSNEIKLDPRNVFIINNDIGDAMDDGDYIPPSILQAGINLQFDINPDSYNPNTYNLEYSIDGRNWKVLKNIVGTEENKGFLYPTLFPLIKDTIEEEELDLNQADYPFLFNSNSTKQSLANEIQALDEYKIGGITIGLANPITPTASNTYVDITNALNSYLGTWLQAQATDTSSNGLKRQLGIDQINANINNIINAPYERQSNKKSSISDSDSRDTMGYPSAQATVNYVGSKVSGLQSSINSSISSINNKLTDTGWLTPSLQLFKNYYNEGYMPFKMRKKHGIVHITGSIKPKSSLTWKQLRAEVFLCNLPEGFAPPNAELFPITYGYRRMYLSVAADKRITIGLADTKELTITTAGRLDINATYFVD